MAKRHCLHAMYGVSVCVIIFQLGLHVLNLDETAKTKYYQADGISGWLSCLLVYYLPGKGGYVFGSIGLSVCKHYSKFYERIVIISYGEVWGGKGTTEQLITFWWHSGCS